MKTEKTLRFTPQLGFLDESRLPTDSEETVALKELMGSTHIKHMPRRK